MHISRPKTKTFFCFFPRKKFDFSLKLRLIYEGHVKKFNFWDLTSKLHFNYIIDIVIAKQPAELEHYRLHTERKAFNSCSCESIKNFSVENFQLLNIFISSQNDKILSYRALHWGFNSEITVSAWIMDHLW